MFRHSPTSDRRQPGLHRLCQQAAIHQAFSTSSSPRRSVCKERCCSCPRQGAQPAHAGLSQESSTLQHSSAAQICSDSICFKRSEEHTSELQSPCNLVCRLLL